MAKESEEVPMAIAGGLDGHRRQITFDYVDAETGQVRPGPDRAGGPTAAAPLAAVGDRPAAFAVEARTGCGFVVDELRRAGVDAHLAEPAGTAAARDPSSGPRPTGPTPGSYGSCWPRGDLPESWIAAEQVLEMRGLLQLFKDLRDEHTGWVKRLSPR
jgi:hypothetical protein